MKKVMKVLAYELMHRDKVVAIIDTKTGYNRIENANFMPYSLYLEDVTGVESAVQNINNFYYWCATRLLSLDRKYAKELLNSIGAKQALTDKDRAQIALSYRCLSLRDLYWIRKEGETVLFRNVDLYRHSLDNALVDIALKGRNLTINNSSLIASDLSTSGVFPKAWLRAKNGFVLLKDGGHSVVYREYLASEIAKCFTNDSLEYRLINYQGELVTECDIITSLDYSIVAMEDFEIYCMNNDINFHDYVKKLDAKNYYLMNIIDYLVGNTDRHMGNWGLLINNKTNKPIKLYPLMDFNKSFEAYDSLEGGRCLTVPGIKSQRDAALEAVKILQGLQLIKSIPEDLFIQYKMRNELGAFHKRYSLLLKA
jgi:hypothetical protein